VLDEAVLVREREIDHAPNASRGGRGLARRISPGDGILVVVTPLDRALATVARAPRPAIDLAIGAAPLVVGAASGALTAPAIRSWYRRLERPSWNPPDRVFGPVWTALYATMGVALVRVVRSDRPADARRLAVGLFGLQLALNFGWSWIFFVEHEIGLAVAEILVLWVAIAATAVTFGRLAPSAGLLLVPYLAWVTFAAALNVAVWRRNR
jgi:tryptophan-rich sensory protein